MKKLIALALIQIGIFSYGFTQKIDYLFENPPDSIPKIFAKGIISIEDRYEYGLTISKDYEELFFTAEDPGFGLMVMRKLVDESWSQPEIANLRGDKSWEYEAFYSYDGQKLFFTSNINDTSRLWYSIKNKEKWIKPVLLNSPVNETPVFWATFAKNNNMYYTNLAVFKIFKSKLENGNYVKIEDVGLPFGIHPFISEDESFMLFNGKGDIFVTLKKDDGSWSHPYNLGNQINTKEYQESCPTLSPDKKYIFFSRYNDLNNKSDIYWVSSSIIDKIKKTNLKK